MKKMKPKIKKKWLKALRSGEYTQGHWSLRDEKNRFCCLGVLCNLHAMAHPRIAAKQTDPGVYLGERKHLPKDVQKWSGLDTGFGSLNREYDSHYSSLAILNDRGTSFKEIAKVIEKHF